MAFDRFTARRGVSFICRTDNGTNFRGASKELCHIWQNWDKNKLLEHNYGKIKWLFSAPLAPNTQGAVERMVQQVKRALWLAMAHKSLKEEDFETVVVRSEGLINSRPLTYISTDPKDPRPISPNSFLMSMTEREQNPIHEIECDYLKKRWKETNETLDKLWKYFLRETYRLYIKTQSKAVTLFEETSRRAMWSHCSRNRTNGFGLLQESPG